MAAENISVSPTVWPLGSLLGHGSPALVFPWVLVFHSACVQLFLQPKTQVVPAWVSGFLCASFSSLVLCPADSSPLGNPHVWSFFLPPWLGFYLPVLWFGKPPGRRPERTWISPLLFFFSQSSHPCTICSLVTENSCLIYFVEFYCCLWWVGKSDIPYSVMRMPQVTL